MIFENELAEFGCILSNRLDAGVVNISKKDLEKSINELIDEYHKSYNGNGKRILFTIMYKIKNYLIDITIKNIRKFQIPQANWDDVFQDVLIATMKGIENFNPDKGAKLTTYLYKTINSIVAREISKKYHLVRIKSYNKDKGQHEYFRITEENKNQIFYKLFEDVEDIVEKRETLRIVNEILNESPRELKNVLIKIMSGKKLSKKDKGIFNKYKPRIIRYLEYRGIV